MARSIHRLEVRCDLCVVFGAEGEGLSAEVLDACDEGVSIPMDAGVDSLNVAAASAVVFSEIRRRRLEGG
jgi:tRNA G18 (ribose-2'-O)-methylase SpoU